MLSDNVYARDGFTLMVGLSVCATAATGFYKLIDYVGGGTVVFTRPSDGTNFQVGSVACAPAPSPPATPSSSPSVTGSPSPVFSLGDVYTIAGDAAGTAGYDGDGGFATRALLNLPQGFAFDAAGNYAVADNVSRAPRPTRQHCALLPQKQIAA